MHHALCGSETGGLQPSRRRLNNRAAMAVKAQCDLFQKADYAAKSFSDEVFVSRTAFYVYDG